MSDPWGYLFCVGEHSGVITAADRRRPLPALRPFLVVGGFVFLWWCLATGTAHADGTPERGASLVDHALPAAAAHPVPQKHATHAEPAERRVSVTAVVERVRQTPTTTETVAAVRAVVEPVVRQTRAIVDATPAGPAVGAVLSKVESLSANPPVVEESSTQQGETQTPRASEKGPRARSSATPSADAGTPFTPRTTAFSVSEDRLSHTTPAAGAPDGDPFQQPAHPRSSSVQAGSSAQVISGLLVTPLELQESASATARPRPNDRLHSGPAYPPAASPD